MNAIGIADKATLDLVKANTDDILINTAPRGLGEISGFKNAEFFNTSLTENGIELGASKQNPIEFSQLTTSTTFNFNSPQYGIEQRLTPQFFIDKGITLLKSFSFKLDCSGATTTQTLAFDVVAGTTLLYNETLTQASHALYPSYTTITFSNAIDISEYIKEGKNIIFRFTPILSTSPTYYLRLYINSTNLISSNYGAVYTASDYWNTPTITNYVLGFTINGYGIGDEGVSVIKYTPSNVVEWDKFQLAKEVSANSNITTHLLNKLEYHGVTVDPSLVSNTVFSIDGGSNASYPASNAFDSNDFSYWYSSQVGTGISGVAWIGQQYNYPIKVTHIKYKSTTSNFAIPSGIFQYSDNAMSWTSIATLTLPTDGSLAEFDTPDVGEHKCWRLLANANLTSSYPWRVASIELHDTTLTSWQSLSNLGDITGAKVICTNDAQEGRVISVSASNINRDTHIYQFSENVPLGSTIYVYSVLQENISDGASISSLQGNKKDALLMFVLTRTSGIISSPILYNAMVTLHGDAYDLNGSIEQILSKMSKGLVIPSWTLRASLDNLVSHGTETETKKEEIMVYVDGWIRVSVDLRSTRTGETVYAKIYINGTSKSIFSSTESNFKKYFADLRVSPYDTVELWLDVGTNSDGDANAQNFKIYYDYLGVETS